MSAYCSLASNPGSLLGEGRGGEPDAHCPRIYAINLEILIFVCLSVCKREPGPQKYAQKSSVLAAVWAKDAYCD